MEIEDQLYDMTSTLTQTLNQLSMSEILSTSFFTWIFLKITLLSASHIQLLLFYWNKKNFKFTTLVNI